MPKPDDFSNMCHWFVTARKLWRKDIYACKIQGPVKSQSEFGHLTACVFALFLNSFSVS